jgi:hypothetical protein
MKQDWTGPIFIVGMNGSGTTMLADALNHHPQIYIHRVESRIIPYYCQQLGTFGDTQQEDNFRKLVDDFANNYAFRVCNNNKRPKIEYEFNALSVPNFPTAIDLTFSFFAARENKVVWGDHSPSYGAFIPYLQSLFPQVKIIHLIRDGRDCAQSFKRRFGQNVYRAMVTWKKLVRKAHRDGLAAGPDRYLEVKYENLTSDPETHMRQILSFIGLPFDSSVLNSSMPMYKVSEGSLKNNHPATIVPNSGKWREFFSHSEIRKMEQIGGAALREAGYETQYCEGDRDVVAPLLFYWKILDKINASFDFFRRYKGPNKWGIFFSLMMTSLKQERSKKLG